MINKKKFDFAAHLKSVEENYQMIQILNEKGDIVNSDLVPDLSNEELVQLFKDMLWSRALNDRSVILARQGRLGFFGPSAGQEASQLASCLAFDKNDYLLPGYRDIPILVKRGLPLYKAFLWSKGHVEGGMYPEDFLSTTPEIIIGAQFIKAAGVGLGFKKRGKKQVVFTYTGDGGSSQGDFYEGINVAGAFKVPVVFIVQNNQYAISTPWRKQTAANTLAQKAAAAGIPGVLVDGMDPLAVYAVAKAARDWTLAGNGPILIETFTSRFQPHSMSGDDPKLYRDEDSYAEWEGKDPMIRMRTYLTKKGLWDQDQEEGLIKQFDQQIQEAVKKADDAPKQKISQLLELMFEEPTQVLKEQIESYKKKEGE